MTLQRQAADSRSIRRLLGPHARTLSLGLLAVIGEGAANLLEPWPLKVVLDCVVKSKPAAGRISHWIVTTFHGDRILILKVTVASVLAIAALGAVCSYAEKFLTTTVGQWVMHDLRRTLYAHIQRLSLDYHDHKRTGDLISRVTTDIDAIQAFITSGLLSSFTDVLTLTGMVVVMFFLNWRFTLIALAVAPVLFLVIYDYTRRIKKASREVRKKEGEIVSVVQEVLSSIRVVKAFAREDYEQRRLEEESLESLETTLRARSLKAKLLPLVEIIVAVGTCAVLWFGSRLVLRGRLEPGSLVVFILYLGKMYKPMQDLSKMTDTFSKAMVGWERIQEVLQTEQQVRDMPGARRAPPLKGTIEFQNVSFAYDKSQPVLRDVSFNIQAGQVAAFVGPTGAGKTTIISLVPRFYDPNSGVIRLDGLDVRRLTQDSIRRQISFVLQETILFHAPLWKNIAYGKPDATRAEILRAAEMALAHEFIEKMAHGYDTIVGERGVTLSGGQRQRIAIARALIRNTPILILDEPSSNLDAESERLVFEALDRLMVGRTCLVIAHRLSTVRRADVVFVIKDGAIVEQGRHAELVQSGGLYSDLYALQVHGDGDDRRDVPDAVVLSPSGASSEWPRGFKM
jgi:ATP-binding cassette, subfamily B, bacterial